MKARLAEAEFEVDLYEPVYKGLAHLGVDLLERRHRVVADMQRDERNVAVSFSSISKLFTFKYYAVSFSSISKLVTFKYLKSPTHSRSQAHTAQL